MSLILAKKDVLQAPVLPLENNELHVAIYSLSIGGAERIVLDWAERIYPRWRVHLIVLCDRQEEWPVPSFVRVTRLGGSDIINKLKFIGHEIARSGNPVCTCHLMTKPLRDALVSGGAYVVNVLHNAKHGWPESACDLVGTDQVIAVSGDCYNDLRMAGWDGPVSVIRHIPPIPRKISDARERLRRTWRIPQDAFVIGMVGAIKPQKNYTLAIRVLKKVLETKDAYLVILGGPVNTNKGRPAWDNLMSEINRLGVRNRVAMPGFIPHATDCFPAFDVMLNTSHFEGLSIATLEMLQSGLPVVASRVGGQGELSCDSLLLVDQSADESEWSHQILSASGMNGSEPVWSKFPSHRLWTLAGLAHNYEPRDKILFITANLSSGGAQRSLVNLTKEMNGLADISIGVAGISSADHFYRELADAGVDVFRTGDPWNAFDYAELLVQKICADRIGTVCFWNLDARIKLLIAKTLAHTGLKIVDVSPGDHLYEEMAAVRDFQDWIGYTQQEFFARIDHLVLKYAGGYPPECEGRVSVIRNGVPVSKNQKRGYAIDGAPSIVVNGRIAPSKFLVEIIQAVAIARQKIPDLELHVYGAAEPYHGGYAEDVSAKAAELLPAGAVFHGLDFSAMENLHQHDVFVVLGKGQGCPNALLEAMSVGMPCIANDDGGTKEQLVHEKTGLLVSSTSPIELAEEMARLLEDRALAKRLGESAWAHVSANFSMKSMAEAYMKLLRNDSGEWSAESKVI